jgi:hypothetical protein
MKTKRLILCLLTSFAAFFGIATAFANPSPQEEVATSSRALSTSPNYSWTATAAAPQSSAIRPLSIEGKAEKDGLTSVILRFGGRTIEGYLVGNKAYVTSPDLNWDSIPEMQKGERPGQFMERMVREVVPPARQITELAQSTTTMSKDGEVFSGDIDEMSGQTLLEPHAPGVKSGVVAKSTGGKVKLWTKGRDVTKYEFTVNATATVDGKQIDASRTTTVEIKDVGTTAVTLPARAREKLGLN